MTNVTKNLLKLDGTPKTVSDVRTAMRKAVEKKYPAGHESRELAMAVLGTVEKNGFDDIKSAATFAAKEGSTVAAEILHTACYAMQAIADAPARAYLDRTMPTASPAVK